MAYMSYCRFEGTYQELKTCMNTVEEHEREEAEYPVSENEVGFFRRIVEEFHYWMQEMEILLDDGELDYETLDRICEAMRKGCEPQEEEEC